MTTTRRADIQGLRAVAVVVVVLFHADLWLVGGYLGVDVFFVVSGYVITQLLRREFHSTGTISLRHFYTRRVRRLLPALALMMAVVLPASILFASHGAQADTAGTGIAAALFNANSYLSFFGFDGGYFALDSKSNPLLHTWSLSVEEQFYFVYPALLLWVGRLSGPRDARRFAVAIGAIATASLLAWITVDVTVADPTGHSLTFYLMPFRAWEFAVGALCAHGVARLPAQFRLGPLVGTAGLLTVVGACFTSSQVHNSLAPMALAVVGSAMVLVGGATAGRNPARWILSRRPMVVLGDISYSWYLWHWPLIVFANATWGDRAYAPAAAAVLSLIPAAVSYRFVEDRIRNDATMKGARAARLAASSVVAPILAAAVLLVGQHQLASASFISDARFHLDERSGCVNPVPIGERDPDACLWNTEGSAGEILLIGDSSAGQFSEAVVGAGTELDFRVRVATHWGCPFVELRLVKQQQEFEECAEFVRGNMEWIRDNPPDLVIVSVASDYYIETDLFELAPIDAPELAESPARKAAVWEAALNSTLASVTDTGARVLLIQNVPKFRSRWDAYSISPFRVLIDPDGIGVTQSRASVERFRERGLHAELAATDGLDGVSLLDLFDELCPEDTCSSLDGSVWMYRDRHHISISASEGFVDELRTAIEAALA